MKDVYGKTEVHLAGSMQSTQKGMHGGKQKTQAPSATRGVCGGQGQKRMVFKDERMLLAGKCSPITNSDKITKLFKGRWVNIPISHLQILAAGTLSLR